MIRPFFPAPSAAVTPRPSDRARGRRKQNAHAMPAWSAREMKNRLAPKTNPGRFDRVPGPTAGAERKFASPLPRPLKERKNDTPGNLLAHVALRIHLAAPTKKEALLEIRK